MAKNNDGWEKVETSPAWDFDEKKELVGLFISKEENVGENNSNLYTFELLDHSHYAVWGTTVLDIRFKNLKFGEEVKVVYLGKKPSPTRKGQFYRDFDVFHRMPSFEKVDEEAGQEVGA